MARLRVYDRQLPPERSGRRTVFNLIILAVLALIVARALLAQQPEPHAFVSIYGMVPTVSECRLREKRADFHDDLPLVP